MTGRPASFHGLIVLSFSVSSGEFSRCAGLIEGLATRRRLYWRGAASGVRTASCQPVVVCSNDQRSAMQMRPQLYTATLWPAERSLQFLADRKPRNSLLSYQEICSLALI
ncbi:hypothetical protein RRG08_014821 [Elysia crispata]|uniref:Secreted protein n=1 Tax=Elysia crispata TaxID=231223 RepID=A0AAE1DC04_9GAST|nr:hypothetical protein RRG08_014821 [Elysia crispata]